MSKLKTNQALVDYLQLINVRYGSDGALISLRDGELLAAAGSFIHTPTSIPILMLWDADMEALFGDAHSWGAVIPMLQEHYDWESKTLPSPNKLKSYYGK